MSQDQVSSSIEYHKDENITLTVEQPQNGFWVSLRLIARIPLPPDEVFELLTHPDNTKIFRSIKAMHNRKIIKDDKHGKQEIEVDQVGRWRFGPFGGSFNVKLRVNQDKRHHTMDFKLIPSRGAFMHDFSGGWKIQPYNADSVEEMVTYPGRHWGPLHSMRKALHQLEDAITGKHSNSSLVVLHQSIAPGLLPPPPLDRVLMKITIKQVRLIMSDLLQAAERINRERAQEAAEETKTADKDKSALKSHLRKLK